MPRHEQKRITHGIHTAEIDEGLADLILEAWRAGCFTDASCEEIEPGTAMIQFSSRYDGRRFLNAVTMIEVRERGNTSAGGDDAKRAMTVYFPKDATPRMVQVLSRHRV